MGSRLFVVIAVVFTVVACHDQPFAPRDDVSPNATLMADGGASHLRNGGTAELPPPPGSTDVFPRDVNRDGNVVGTSVGPGGPVSVLWRPASHFASGRSSPVLEFLAPLEHPVSIDDDERVAGRVGDLAAVWVEGVITPIGALSGDDLSVVNAGSATGGWVVGDSWPSSEDFDVAARGFLWSAGVIRELPPLTGDQSSRGRWVNSSGVAVGVSFGPDAERGTVVVWKNGEPVSTGFEHATHEPMGISDGGDVLISATSGNEILTWRDGRVRRFPHPTPDDPSASYRGLRISADGAVLASVDVDEPLVATRFGRYGRGGGFVFIGTSPLLACPFFDGSFAVCLSPTRTHPFTVLVDGRVLRRGAVDDLTVTEQGATTATLRWTQVADGRGRPGHYRVRYSAAPISAYDWSGATRGCDVRGTEIGAETGCSIDGLENGVAYDFQLMSYRLRDDGRWAGARYSTVGIGEPGARPPGTVVASRR